MRQKKNIANIAIPLTTYIFDAFNFMRLNIDLIDTKGVDNSIR